MTMEPLQFSIEQMGPDNHYIVTEPFSAQNHAEALKYFRSKFPTDPERNPAMLRDWQRYRVTEDTLNFCHCYSWIAKHSPASSNGRMRSL